MSADPYRYFRVEARDILDELGKGVLLLEKGPADSDLLARLLRLAHTLKGAARVVKQREIADLAHSLEDALSPLRGIDDRPSRETIDNALKLLDRMTAKMAGLAPVDDDASSKMSAPVAEMMPVARADLAEVA